MQRLLNNRHFLGLLFMLPAGVLLLVFLTYPLGLGTWLGFTDTKVGRAGIWVGLDNFKYLNDSLGHSAGDSLLVSFSERAAIGKPLVLARVAAWVDACMPRRMAPSECQAAPNSVFTKLLVGLAALAEPGVMLPGKPSLA